MWMLISPPLLRIYRNSLAKFFIFRLFKALLLVTYRSVYYFHSLLARHPQTGSYAFRSLSECMTGVSLNTLTLDLGESIEIPPAAYSGFGSEIASRENGAIKIDSPVLKIYEFPASMVVGGVEFAFVNQMAIHHDLFNPSQHSCPAENLGVVSLSRATNGLELRLTKRAKRISAAVTLIGQCSGNYAHWLTETLPKLPLLDSSDQFSHLPLLVDDGLHPNMYASIQLVSKNCREIIRVKQWEPILLDRLVTVSQPGYERYVPHGISSRVAPAYINTFSRTALRLLRDAACRALEGYSQSHAPRIYLSRSEKSGNIRQIENSSTIESVVRAYGAEVITPETMSFMEQVAACINVKTIVGPIGASMANMIFAPPGCKIILLAPYYDQVSYFYYSNLAGVLGHELHYVLGAQIDRGQHPAHRNYYIVEELLMATLGQTADRVSAT
jgi:capsular polysaccharide biosynthesis protein